MNLCNAVYLRVPSKYIGMLFRKLWLDKYDRREAEHIVFSFHNATTNIKKKKTQIRGEWNDDKINKIKPV